MAGRSDALTHWLTATFANGPRVTVIARYDAQDPLVLLFHFVGARPGTDWQFSRDLLVEALLWGGAGDGDVRFRADDDESCVDWLWLVLDSPDGHAELRLAVSELTDLAARMEHLAPGDGAPVDWDAELRHLANWGVA
jgi:sporulation and cell division protein SsgA